MISFVGKAGKIKGEGISLHYASTHQSQLSTLHVINFYKVIILKAGVPFST